MKLRSIAMTVLIVAQFVDLVDSTIANVALVTIQRNLHLAASSLEWIMTGYMIAYAVVMITGGRLGDIYGRKPVFFIAVVGFGAMSLINSVAQSGAVLISGRVVQGAFAGIMIPQVLASVQVMYSKEERAKIYAIIGTLAALGAVTGLVLGGWMVSANLWGTSWRSIFIVNIPICLILAIATILVVPNSKAEGQVKLDPLGVLLSAGAIFLLVYGLIEGRHENWAPWIWVMIAAAPCLAAVFVLQQNRKLARDRSALLPMRLFRNRGFSSGLAVQFLFWVGTGSYSLILGYYLQQALGFSAFHAGMTIFAMVVGSIIISMAITPLAKKFGRLLVFFGGIAQGAAFAWMILVIHSHPKGLSSWDLAWPLALAGGGLVMLVIPLLDEALAMVPEADAGVASGTFNTFQQVGSSLGIAVAGVIFFGRAGLIPTQASLTQGVMEGLWVTVAAFGAAGLMGLLLPSHRRAEADPQAPIPAVQPAEL